MRVLFLAHAYPRHDADPVGSFVGNLAVALRDRGVDVTVSAPSARGSRAVRARERHPGASLSLRARSLRDARLHRDDGRAGARHAERQGRDALVPRERVSRRARARATRAIRSRARALVVSRRAGGVGRSRAPRRFHSSRRCTAPISDSRRPFPSGARCSDAWRREGRAMTAVSTWLARGAEELAPGRSVAVAPMPVLTDLFHPGDARESDLLLFVGKLTEQKGLAPSAARDDAHAPARSSHGRRRGTRGRLGASRDGARARPRRHGSSGCRCSRSRSSRPSIVARRCTSSRRSTRGWASPPSSRC